MPNCVLYSDDDMEPITVLNVPSWAFSRLNGGERIRFAVQQEVHLGLDDDPATFVSMPIVTVWAERFCRRGQASLMFFTRDDVHALLLKADFLPGQRNELREREREAFGRGFIKGLQMALGGP